MATSATTPHEQLDTMALSPFQPGLPSESSSEADHTIPTPSVQATPFEASDSSVHDFSYRHSNVPETDTAPAVLTSYQERLPSIMKPMTIQLHDGSLSKALKALTDRDIPVVEYGSQILYRWGWEEVLMDVEWAVPDEFLAFASQVLTETGFPWEPSPKRCNHKLWGWVNMCQLHITDTTHEKQLYLYPLSSLHLTLEDTFEVASTFDRDLRLLTPKPPRYMLSMIHHLLKFPVSDTMRHRVIIDLAGFIHGCIFHGPTADTQYNTAEEEETAENEFLEKIPHAINEIKGWDWGDVRDEEYLKIAETIVDDPRTLETITRVV